MSSRQISGAAAIREATELALRRDDKVYLLGEGVADPKGIFGTTIGLVERFGPERVVEMPVSENGLTGIAIGSALMGRKPILIHQRVDFSLLSIEQLFNNAAKTAWLTQGHYSVPLVVRMIVGRGWGQGPAHSQSLEPLFALVPGLKVVMPTTPRSAKGQLLAAIEDPNPVIFLEHRWVHYAKGDVPEEYYTVPIDRAHLLRSGGDVTIVATSYMLLEAVRAAEGLGEIGIQADLIDLVSARPLDMDAILSSVRRTGRLLVVDTGFKQFGLGAEIIARVVEQAMSHLRAPPRRLGLPDHPTPSARALIGGFYPTAQTIFDAAADLAEVPPERAYEVSKVIAVELARTPIDVPNPQFQGPF